MFTIPTLGGYWHCYISLFVHEKSERMRIISRYVRDDLWHGWVELSWDAVRIMRICQELTDDIWNSPAIICSPSHFDLWLHKSILPYRYLAVYNYIHYVAYVYVYIYIYTYTDKYTWANVFLYLYICYICTDARCFFFTSKFHSFNAPAMSTTHHDVPRGSSRCSSRCTSCLAGAMKTIRKTHENRSFSRKPWWVFRWSFIYLDLLTVFLFFPGGVYRINIRMICTVGRIQKLDHRSWSL